MKDLNMKSFYRHEVPVNRKKTDLSVNKKINKGTKKLSSRGEVIANTNEVRGFVYHKDAEANHRSVKALITHYDDMLSDNLVND
jgi:hypothetical protein